DLVHLNPCEILAMPDGALVLFLALEFENDGLIAAAMRHDGSSHSRALRVRTGLHGIAVNHSEHPPDFDLGSGFARNCFNINGLAWGDAILLPAGFDHCVHSKPLESGLGFCQAVSA